LYQRLYGKGRCQMALFLIPHGAFLCTMWLIFMRLLAHFYAPVGSLYIVLNRELNFETDRIVLDTVT
jgi:hypothetical protein